MSDLAVLGAGLCLGAVSSVYDIIEEVVAAGIWKI